MEISALENLPRGAVTIHDWRALVGSLKDAIPVAQREHAGFVELGVLHAQTTENIFKVLDAFGCGGPLLSVDSAKSSEQQYHSRKFPPSVYGVFKRLLSWEAASAVAITGYRVAWIFIDACHCFDCVSRDIAAWAPLVVPGGVMAFHDSGQEQIDAKQLVHERYHADGIVRRYGVATACDKAKELEDFELVKEVSPIKRETKQPPYFGGVRIYRRDDG